VAVPTPAGQPRGVVRLLNTSGGGALCLAGEVDAAAVEAFHRRYGLEPTRVAVIDAGSVTALSAAALDLLLDHLDAAERAGRPVRVRRSPLVERLMDGPDGVSGG
jgi:anti-anti-sigma regulatory factor